MRVALLLAIGSLGFQVFAQDGHGGVLTAAPSRTCDGSPSHPPSASASQPPSSSILESTTSPMSISASISPSPPSSPNPSTGRGAILEQLVREIQNLEFENNLSENANPVSSTETPAGPPNPVPESSSDSDPSFSQSAYASSSPTLPSQAFVSSPIDATNSPVVDSPQVEIPHPEVPHGELPPPTLLPNFPSFSEFHEKVIEDEQRVVCEDSSENQDRDSSSYSNNGGAADDDVDFNREDDGDPVVPEKVTIKPLSASNSSSPSTAADPPQYQPHTHAQPIEGPRFNYASFDCGAVIVSTNPGSKGSTAILTENKDSYMLNKCHVEKWVFVELCEEILVEEVQLANYEFFSRTLKSVYCSRYPPSTSHVLGTFTASPHRQIQRFKIPNPMAWTRYLKLEFISHYGHEYYCPMSLVRVFGKTMMEEMKEEANKKEPETAAQGHQEQVQPQLTGDTTGLVTQVKRSKPLNEMLADGKFDMTNISDMELEESGGFGTTQITPIEALFRLTFFGNAASGSGSGASPVNSNSNGNNPQSGGPHESPYPSPASASSSSSSSQPVSSSPQQQSFFKQLQKRISVLEKNFTVNYKYLEEQSKLLNSVFKNLDDEWTKILGVVKEVYQRERRLWNEVKELRGFVDEIEGWVIGIEGRIDRVERWSIVWRLIEVSAILVWAMLKVLSVKRRRGLTDAGARAGGGGVARETVDETTLGSSSSTPNPVLSNLVTRLRASTSYSPTTDIRPCSPTPLSAKARDLQVSPPHGTPQPFQSLPSTPVKIVEGGFGSGNGGGSGTNNTIRKRKRNRGSLSSLVSIKDKENSVVKGATGEISNITSADGLISTCGRSPVLLPSKTRRNSEDTGQNSPSSPLWNRGERSSGSTGRRVLSGEEESEDWEGGMPLLVSGSSPTHDEVLRSPGKGGSNRKRK